MTVTDSPKPLPAASLLLIEPGRQRVLMGRRPDTTRFMPGVYVFPGGAVESSDGSVATHRGLPEEEVRLVAVADDIAPETLAVTAIRETYEETRILCPGQGSLPHCDWPQLIASDWRPDLARLRYLGRALTPPGHHKRYHARFFFTYAESDGLPVACTRELEDLRWVDPGGGEGLPIAPVTRFMLGELRRRLAVSGSPGRTPFYYWRGAVEQVDYDRPFEVDPVAPSSSR